MYTEIKNRFNDAIIISGEYDSIKDALEKNSGANLSGANLSGAIVFICGSRHILQYNKSIGELRIGCHVYHLEYWLIMFDVIGKKEEYTDEQITEYHNYMKMLKNYL